MKFPESWFLGDLTGICGFRFTPVWTYQICIISGNFGLDFCILNTYTTLPAPFLK